MSTKCVGCVCIVVDDVSFDSSFEDAIGCNRFIGAKRQISAAGALQADRPAQCKVRSPNLCNEIRKTKQKLSLI